MNWFQRYTIPGVYFIALTTSWFHALYCYKTFNELSDLNTLITIAIVIVFPIGYIISVLQQFLYYRCAVLAIHMKVNKEANTTFSKLRDFFSLPSPENELEAEHISAFFLVKYTQNHEKEVDIRQDLIRKRMDVIAINLSIIVATLLALFTAFILGIFSGLSLQPKLKELISISIISGLIVSLMWASRKSLCKQVIKFLIKRYEDYEKYFKKPKKSRNKLYLYPTYNLGHRGKFKRR